MWYPSQQQQQQYSWYGYVHHPSSQEQQQQTYSRTSYYCNDDELSTTCIVAIDDENESPVHCQTPYGGSNVHVTTSDVYVINSNNSYGDEMSSYQTTPIRKTYWNPVIAAPTKTMTVVTSSSRPVISSSSSSSSSSACWDWLLFSPLYYSEFYTPSSTFVYQQKTDEEKTDEFDLNFLASLPTCLLALLYLTPKLIPISNDENDSDQEINSLHRIDEPLLSSSISKNNLSSNLSLSSANNNNKSNSNLDGQTNRSSTPDTDDGYQSASDASRSDYSHRSSIPSDHHSQDDININEHSLPRPLMPPRISYAAAVKPIITSANKISSLPTTIAKPKQIIYNASSKATVTNDMLNSNGQKLKFIAPRFERMHHAKQYSSSSSSSSTIKNSSTTSSNRTQTRSTNNNQRNHTLNTTRRR